MTGVALQTVKVWLGRKQKPDASPAELWRDTGRVRSARTNNYYLKRLRYALSGAHKTQDRSPACRPCPCGLFFTAEKVKADEDQFAYGGDEGYELLQQLAAQAKARASRTRTTSTTSGRAM